MNKRRSISLLAAAMMFAAAAVFAAGTAQALDPSVSISAPPSSTIGALAASAWDGSSIERPTQDGSTVTIGSAAQLAWLAQQSVAKEFVDAETIQITSDIDLGGHEWTPIPGDFIADIKTIDGGGHIIKGLKISGTQNSSVGLFGTIYGSVYDLHLVDVNIDVTVSDGPQTANNVGALAGVLDGSGDRANMTGCTVQGAITVRPGGGDGNSSVGGLVGVSNGPTSTFEGCSANVSIRSEASGVGSSTGGIVGASNGGIEFDMCVSDGSVYSNSTAAGGILGSAITSLRFNNCMNRASVTLISKLSAGSSNTAFGAGGLAGAAQNILDVDIESCVNYGTIKLEGTAGASSADLVGGSGGLIGAIMGAETANVSKSMNVGAVSNSATTGTMGGSGKMYRGTGGIVGAAKREINDDSPQIEIENFRNTAAISSTNGDPAGGLIGLINDNSTAQSPPKQIAELACFYNIGDIASTGGTAGGAIGSIEETGTQVQVALDRGYSIVVPTGTSVGGAVGSISANVNVTVVDPNDKKFAHPVGAYLIGTVPAGTAGGSDANYQKDLSDPNSFRYQSGAFWDGFDDDGFFLPPQIKKSEFSQISGITLTNARPIPNDDGSVSLRVAVLPDATVRDSIQVSTYSVSEYDPSEQSGAVIAAGLTIDSSGLLTVPADKAEPLKEGMIITVSVENDPDARGVGRLSLMYDTAPSEHEVREIAVRGTPLTPEDRTTKQLYIEWTDANGAVHSADRPLDMPSVEWSVVPPADPNWQVDVSAADADPFRAALTIGAPRSANVAFQEYAVRVVLSYGAASGDIVYVRKFCAGSFPTKVMISPEDAEMIDAANSVLARTKVAILPGNFQPPIPAHIQAMIERRLDEGLVTYVTDQSIAANSTIKADTELFILSDMDMIESMMVENPVESSLPVCFVSAKKDSANITLDLANGPVAVRDKVVLLPMTFSVTFGKNEMAEFFGADAADILAAPTSETSLAKIFDVLVLHKRIKEGAMSGWYTRLVDGVASPTEALSLGMLQADASDGELTVRLAYNVINFAGESFVVSGPYTEGGSDTIGYMILPDGLQNDSLVDPLWSNLWTRTQNDVASGGGGGCAVGTAAAVLAALIAARRKRG